MAVPKTVMNTLTMNSISNEPLLNTPSHGLTASRAYLFATKQSSNTGLL